MGPASTALLAALLPTCLLIIALTFLSIYLYVKLRASHVVHSKLRAEATTTEQQPVSADLDEWRHPLPPLEPISSLSDASNIDWVNDIMHVFRHISHWPLFNKDEKAFTDPRDELHVERSLKAVGYQGVPPVLILRWLQNRATRFIAAEHIAISFGLARTSFESESDATLFPFSLEVYKDLQNFFKALEGIKFSPEVSTILSKMPSELAAKCGGINKAVFDTTIKDLEELFLPLVPWNLLQAHGGHFPHIQNAVAGAFADIVTVRLRMLGSREQFEFRWDESTETTICCRPAVYSHAGSDGVLLDEPKLWCKSDTYDLIEDGVAIYRE